MKTVYQWCKSRLPVPPFVAVAAAAATLGGCSIAPLTTSPADVGDPGYVTPNTTPRVATGFYRVNTGDAPASSATAFGRAPSSIAGWNRSSIADPVLRFKQCGSASWYGKAFNGRRTASGERYDMRALTAAHRTLPLGSWVRVTALGNARSIIVRINDRGPYTRGRVIDLSYAAAVALGLQHAASPRVEIDGVEQRGSKHLAVD